MAWTKERPTKPGRYWFYGDIFWGGMNRPPEDMKPNLEIVDALVISNGIALSCCSEFVGRKTGHGVYWDEPIPQPTLPADIGLPEKRG